MAHQIVIFNEAMYIIGGFEGTRSSSYLNDVYRTSDGKNWEVVTDNADFAPRRSPQIVIFNNEMYLIFGSLQKTIEVKGKKRKKVVAATDVWRSSDGEGWVRVTDNAAGITPSRSSYSTVVFNNKIRGCTI